MSFALTQLGTYTTGVFDEGAAEIPAYDPASQRLFVINANANTVDILDLRDPTRPTLIQTIDFNAFGGGANSVAVKNGLVAVAVAADTSQAPGQVVFFDANGNVLKSVTVGSLPDMLTFTPDGQTVLVANEGEPSDDYTVDPEGSVSLIDLSRGVAQATVTTAGFSGVPLEGPVRIFGPNASAAQDLEPEYITVSADGKKAYVTLQENNALGILDLQTGTFEKVVSFGFKDHSLPGNGLDASDRDNAINIQNWPVFGMYQPDAIASFTVKGQTFLVTANEGDARDYEAFTEESRIRDLGLDRLDSTAFPNRSSLRDNANLGRLTITTSLGDTDGDGDIDQLYTFGTRSFSIWDSQGNLVYDSGDDFEHITASQFPAFFNADNTNNSFDNRSDNKGPEPEGVVVGEAYGKTFAFIGLERIGGVMVYDLSNPQSPSFVQYLNNRNFAADVESMAAGDLGPEGLVFISAKDSPEGVPLLVVSNEISGSTTVYEFAPDIPDNARTGTNRTDALNGTGADEFILGLEGNDTINSNGGTDHLFGGEGHDQINGSSAKDYIQGGNGNDRINGNGGSDTLLGGAGQDQINGSSSSEFIHGGSGNDGLNGNGGNDHLLGGAGDDTINTGSGDDLINGGLGDDLIQLNGGRDIVVLEAGEGFDTIRNFQLNLTRFDVGNISDLSFVRSGNGVNISQGADLLAFVENVQVATLQTNSAAIFS